MKIFAIVVTFNPEQPLIDLQYQSLASQVDKVVYIDNSSVQTQSNFEFVDNEKCFIIRNGENKGLGYAQNQGINWAIENEADFILLLDQDSIPSDGFVLQLHNVYVKASHNKKVGLVGAAIRSAYENTSANEPGVILKKNGTIRRVPLQQITDVSYCIASGSLIPIEALLEVGLIKEELFIDVLDLEWCLRAKSKGYSIIQTDAVYISHRLGNGTNDKIKSHSPIREYYIVRNNIWLSKQNYILLGYRVRKNISIVFRIFLSIVRGHWSYVKQQLKGIKDGWNL